MSRVATCLWAAGQSRSRPAFPRSYPPFVLYPSGEVKPLRVTEPRALDADSELLKIDLFAFLYEIGAEEKSDGLWAADVEAAEIFPLAGSPSGHVWNSFRVTGPPIISGSTFLDATAHW